MQNRRMIIFILLLYREYIKYIRPLYVLVGIHIIQYLHIEKYDYLLPLLYFLVCEEVSLHIIESFLTCSLTTLIIPKPRNDEK